MSITIDQIIQDAQRIANRVKDLEALGNALLIEAEGNNRQIETMKQYQDDIDSLNKLARDKTNAEMVNRIYQQNPSIREIRQENRELKASLEDHQRALELIMHKYREHTQHKILTSHINFKELCNAKNAKMENIIRKQSEKITEMAAVMQHAAAIDDELNNKEIECVNRLQIENQGLRELLKISKQFGSDALRIDLEDKAIQTEIVENDNKNIMLMDIKQEQEQEQGQQQQQEKEKEQEEQIILENGESSSTTSLNSLSSVETIKRKTHPQPQKVTTAGVIIEDETIRTPTITATVETTITSAMATTTTTTTTISNLTITPSTTLPLLTNGEESKSPEIISS